MENGRIAKMVDNIVASEKIAASPEDDEALVLVDQAFDSILASIRVIDENMPKIKTNGVPQQAARDAIVDIMETAIHPYFSDVLKAMQSFEEIGGQ